MSAELLAKLIEAGTPAALVAEVAMELGRAEAVKEVVEKKRAYDREYQSERRNRTTSYDTNDVGDKGSLEVSPHTPLPNPSKSSPLNPPILEEKREAIATCLRRAFPAPEGVTAEQWAAFRKQRKKPLNERSYTLVTNKLRELEGMGHKPGAMIDLAIERGWETVFEPRTFGNDKGFKPQASNGKQKTPEELRDLAAWYDQHGRRDDAAECRRKAAQREQARAA